MTTSPVMAWLRAGLPLTLLCDLACADGPDSREILLVERDHDTRADGSREEPPEAPTARRAAARAAARPLRGRAPMPV